MRIDHEDLNQRIILLQKWIREGRVRFERPSPIQDSLKKIRYDNKGRVDPASIDQNVHALLTLVELS